MAQAKQGTKIVEIVEAIPYGNLIRTEDVVQQLVKQSVISYDKAKAAINVKLKRLADQGKLKRLQKGVYCHIEQTIFGPTAPDIDQIMIRDMTERNGVRIGYESGPVLLNRLGLSSLLPRKIKITTNRYNARLPEGCHIELVKPATAITASNWKGLQFIDTVEFLPDAHVDAENPGHLLMSLLKKQGLDPLELILTARKYYSAKTVLRLTDLFMEGNDGSTSR